MRTTLLRYFPLVIAAIVACSSPAEPPVLTPVVLDLRVNDSLGAPVSGVFATWRANRSMPRPRPGTSIHD